MLRLGLLLPLALLIACDGDDKSRQPTQTAGLPGNLNASAWTIGPIVYGKNKSVGTPLHPSVEPDGFSVPIGTDQEPHYVTFNHGSLRGKIIIRMVYRVEADDGTIIYGKGCDVTSPSGITLYFQRAKDDWSTDGDRWWATFATKPMSGGSDSTEILASLDGAWTSVMTETAATAQSHFIRAKDEAKDIGFTIGNCEGFGHGARATAPAKIVVTKFDVE